MKLLERQDKEKPLGVGTQLRLLSIVNSKKERRQDGKNIKREKVLKEGDFFKIKSFINCDKNSPFWDYTLVDKKDNEHHVDSNMVVKYYEIL